MRLPRPRFTVRRLMIIVAITGVAMGYTVHARNILLEEDDFGLGILFVECIGMLVLSVFALPMVFVIHLVRQDHAYADRLRRDDVAGDIHLGAADDSSPKPESL
jgi:hypothetical protein